MHRLLASCATVAVSAALLPVTAGPAHADHSSESHSTAQFLDGSLLPIDLSSVVGIAGASADYFDGHTAGAEVHDNAALDVTALSALTLPLPDLELAIGDLLAISAVNQEAWADPAGDSRSTTGAADLSVDLTALLGTTPVLDTASIHLGAVQSYAEIDGATGDVTRTTTIADATADLHSPLVGQTVTAVDQAVGNLTDTLSTLDTAIQGSVNDAVGDVLSLIGVTGDVTSTTNVTVDTSRLDTAIDGLLTQTLTTDLVSIDLTNGQVTVNLAGGIDLNNLPPNSTLLSPEVLQLVSADIASLLAQLQTDLNDIVTNALDYVDVSIASTTSVTAPVIGTNLGTLTIAYTGTAQDLLDGTSPLVLGGSGVVGTALSPLLDAATTLVQDALGATIDTTLGNVLTTTGAAIDTLVTDLSDQLAPVLELLTAVAAVNLNVQTDNPDGSYSVTAVEVEVLPGVAGGVVLPLATSTVGPNVFAPLSPVLDATDDPVSPGTDAPVTSTGWNPTSEVTLQLTDSGGNPVGAPFTVTTDANGAFPADTTFPVPAGATAGTYTLVATDLLGNTASDALTVITPVLTAPADPVAAGSDAPLTSTGWSPNTVVTVQLTDSGGNPVGNPITVTTDGNGAFPAGTTYPVPAGTTDGQYTLVATDPFGNTATDTLAVDATAPVVAITSPTADEVTDDPTPAITGSLDDPTATVDIVIRDSDSTVVFSGPATVDPTTGDWTITPGTPLPDGDYTVTATATDPAGNTATDGPVAFTVDTTAPVVDVTGPTGPVSDSTPTVTGTVDDPTATVDVVITDSGGTVVFSGPATVDPITGDWTVDAPVLADGDYTVTATATDPAGNTGTDTSSFTVDTTAPALAITGPTAGEVTNDTTPAITGTLDDPTATVDIVIRDSDGTVVFSGPATVDPTTGDWTITPGTPLPDGDYTVTATATDPAGNTATDGPVAFTVDASAPAVAITSPADGSSTNDTTPTVTGTVDDPTATVDVVIRDSGGTVVFSGPATVDPATGTWTVDSGVLPEGDYTVSATATDSTGNTATAGPVAFTVDTTAPAAPVITSPADGSVTSDDTPPISGTGEPGATVEVTVVDAGGTSTTYETVVDGNGNWTVVPTTPLADGDATITATQTDAAGNTSPASDPVTVTIDTTAPDAPVITSPADGSKTTDTTPVVGGTGEPGATVTVSVDGEVVGDATVGSDGTWTLPLTDPLSGGDHTVTATQTDPAGNTSDPASNTFTVDAGVAPPVITSPADGATVGQSPTVTGTGVPGATVTLTVDGTPSGTATVGEGGTWSLTPSDPLSCGIHTLAATQTVDGATSAGSDTVTVTFPCPPSGGELPTTGASLGLATVLLLVLLALGAIVGGTLLIRRRP
jgi:hypothetical protein